MTRQGNTLAGTFQGTDDVTFRAEIVYLPESRLLTWTNSRPTDPKGPLNKPVTMTKVSAGTVYPTTP